MELSPPPLAWQEHTPLATDFNDVYYSRADGLAEARHVFLHGNGLAERLSGYFSTAQGAARSEGESAGAWGSIPPKIITVAETGFGTGLNFLALWQMWRIYNEQREILPTAQGAARSEGVWGSIPHLYYITTELHPLAPQDIVKALAAWPELEPLTQQLLAVYPPAIKGAHRRYLEGGRITIDFLFGDATEMLSRYQPDAGNVKVDAWFLDGFAPAKNETLWNPALYAAMTKLSHAGTTLASFTAAGDVRRGLEAAGFIIQKARGFGHKRDMIVGSMVGESSPNPTLRAAPCAEFKRFASTAIVIGSGIAGISSAWRLAQRGYQVTILEASDTICAGASGNPASAFTPFYPAKWNQRGRLLASGFHAMHHWIQLLKTNGHEIRGMQEGMLMLRSNEDSPRAARATAWQQSLNLPAEIRREVDMAEASDLAGVRLSQGGWYYPMGGWLHMGDFCKALLADAGDKIEIHFGQKATALHHDKGWQVITEDVRDFPRKARREAAGFGGQAPNARSAKNNYSADVVVMANANAASSLLSEIKLESVHGQLIAFDAPEGWKDLRMPLHAGHTLIPMRNEYTAQGAARSVGSGAALAPVKKMYWGASFRHHIHSPDILPEETEMLLEDLASAFPSLYAPLRARRGAIAAGGAEGDGGKTPYKIEITEWAGLRCVHASRLPLIGAVKSQPQGLYLNLAYGARGAVSAAIACDAEMFG